MDPTFLEILACPICKGRLLYDPKNNELICRFDKLAYPIRNDIPIMIFEEARHIDEN
ncbi:MAG: Trm112 family protein [Gammaproteobacteria bacterium]|nr:Trm112 family protein [Gammaproteobacteria bacterium]